MKRTENTIIIYQMSDQSARVKKRVALGKKKTVPGQEKPKNEAATLGRTTDLRIIAETAIPRSTTELQQHHVIDMPCSRSIIKHCIWLFQNHKGVLSAKR